METKERLRKQYTQIRNAIPNETRKQKSMVISEKLLSLSEYQNAENVLCYVSYQSEVNTLFLLERFMKDGKKVYCPKVDGKEMHFLRIRSRNDLFPGAFGILEPSVDAEAFSLKETGNTIVICPGLAFSENGGRLGYGGGFFDRFFAVFPSLLKIGLCFSEQIAEDMKMDSHDVRLDMLVSDTGVFSCQK